MACMMKEKGMAAALVLHTVQLATGTAPWMSAAGQATMP
jgi:hypothetical protein